MLQPTSFCPLTPPKNEIRGLYMTPKTAFYFLGNYGPLVLIALSWYYLWNKPHLLLYYNVGIALNAMINLVIKGLIQQPRPMYDDQKMELLKRHGKEYLYKTGIPFDIFGMPSGHAQTAFFSWAFVYLSLRSREIMYVFIPLMGIVLAQRVFYLYHSWEQVFVGGVVGALFGGLVYYLSQYRKKGVIQEKADDGAPV